MNNQEKVNHWFKHSLNYIETSMGIELTLIEKVRLRELVQDAVKKDSQVKGHYSRFSIPHEATSPFLEWYYGIPIPYEGTHDFLIGREQFKRKYGYDGFQEFWKKIQEESHLP